MSEIFRKKRNVLFEILLILALKSSYLDLKGINTIESISSKMSSIKAPSFFIIISYIVKQYNVL